MQLTRDQINALHHRMKNEDIPTIEVTEDNNGKITFWTTETKAVRKAFPLKPRKNGNGENHS